MISKNVADDIIKMVAVRYNVPHLTIRSASRAEPYVTVRAEAMFVLRRFEVTLKEIGSLFGNRDHTTVMSACQRVKDAFEVRAGYREEVDRVIADAAVIVAKAQAKSAAQAETTIALAKVVEPGEVKEPPLVTLLKTTRDELDRMAQNVHRLSMLVSSAIDRLEGHEQKLITLNEDRADEEIK